MADIETSNITASGNWDFSGGVVVVDTPTDNYHASTKKYVDDNVVAGSSNYWLSGGVAVWPVADKIVSGASFFTRGSSQSFD